MLPDERPRPKRELHPDGELTRRRYQLVRCPGNGRAKFAILSAEVYWYFTHYYDRQTLPHTEEPCAGCIRGVIGRLKGYIGVQGFSTKDLFILELTGNCRDSIDFYANEYKSLRGATLILSRMGRKTNSPVSAVVQPPTAPQPGLPPSMDVEREMERIWYGGKSAMIPTPQFPPGERGEQFELPVDPRVRQASNGHVRTPKTKG